MIGCANDKIKNAVNTALKSGDNGEPNTIVATAYEEENLGTAIQSYELSDTTLIEKLQFLSKFRDDTLSRVATLYGMALNSTGKMAQQNNIEMQGYNLFSRILPFNMLETRRFAVKDSMIFLKQIYRWNFPNRGKRLYQFQKTTLMMFHVKQEWR